MVDAQADLLGIESQHRDAGRTVAAVGFSPQHRELDAGGDAAPVQRARLPPQHEHRDHRHERQDPAGMQARPADDATDHAVPA